MNKQNKQFLKDFKASQRKILKEVSKRVKELQKDEKLKKQQEKELANNFKSTGT